MAASNRYTGEALRVVFESGGADYTLDGDQTAFEVTWNIQTADVSAGLDGGVEVKGTLQEISYSLTVFHTDAAGTAVWSNITPGTEGTLLYGPKGTATGDPKGGSRAIVASKPQTIPFNDGVTRNVEFTGQGTMLFDVDSDTFA